MVNDWIDEVVDLLLSAPGNGDPLLGNVWDSTLVRLGESTKSAAEASRVFHDFPEADVDDMEVASWRPFFVVTDAEVEWRKYSATWDMVAYGAIEVAYTEQTDPAANDHKQAVQYYRAWTAELIRWCAENARTAGVPIAGIRQVVRPQRTPRQLRNPNDPTSDYFWGAWHFVIGERM
jgi:hypothetical protein